MVFSSPSSSPSATSVHRPLAPCRTTSPLDTQQSEDFNAEVTAVEEVDQEVPAGVDGDKHAGHWPEPVGQGGAEDFQHVQHPWYRLTGEEEDRNDKSDSGSLSFSSPELASSRSIDNGVAKFPPDEYTECDKEDHGDNCVEESGEPVVDLHIRPGDEVTVPPELLEVGPPVGDTEEAGEDETGKREGQGMAEERVAEEEEGMDEGEVSLKDDSHGEVDAGGDEDLGDWPEVGDDDGPNSGAVGGAHVGQRVEEKEADKQENVNCHKCHQKLQETSFVLVLGQVAKTKKVEKNSNWSKSDCCPSGENNLKQAHLYCWWLCNYWDGVWEQQSPCPWDISFSRGEKVWPYHNNCYTPKARNICHANPYL